MRSRIALRWKPMRQASTPQDAASTAKKPRMPSRMADGHRERRLGETPAGDDQEHRTQRRQHHGEGRSERAREDPDVLEGLGNQAHGRLAIATGSSASRR